MEDLIKKFGIQPIEIEKETWGDTKETELAWWYQVLEKTDYITNKIIESLIENLADATALNFIGVFIQFVVDIRIHHNDVLKLRKQARKKINELEGEIETETIVI